MKLQVRELQKEDIDQILDYFLLATPEYLRGMGADPAKLPSREKWKSLLLREYGLSYPEKTFFYLIWLLDGQAIGHNNINQIQFGEQAFMHLHMWKPKTRQKGLGPQFLRQTISYFFKHYQLKKLYCEPYALNPAPNRTLPKLGFKFLHAYHTTPGWINFPQTVNRYVLTHQAFQKHF